MTASVSRRTLLSAALFGMGRLVLPPSVFARAKISGTAREKQWRQDLQILAQELPQRAKPLQDAHKKHAFLSRLEHMDKSVGSRTDNQILVSIMQSLALIGDSHTKPALGSFLLPSYPINLYWFKEGLYVTSAGDQCPELLGARLLKIGDTPVEHVLRLLKTLIGHENEWVFKSLVQYLIISAKILNGGGFASDPVQASFEFHLQDGSHRRSTLSAGTDMGNSTSLSSRLLRWSQPEKNYWFQPLPGSEAIYFGYSACWEMPGLPFAAFQRQLLDAITVTRCRRLIIDLRNNGGGSSAILDPLIASLVEKKFPTGPLPVFVLIGRGTQSSAAMNAIELKQKAAAVLVGEPSGAKPNHYGELNELELPNSHLRIQYSTTYFHLWPVDSDRSLYPDIRVTETWKDFNAGRDLALSAALKAPRPLLIRSS
jgi:hypothetical protein